LVDIHLRFVIVNTLQGEKQLLTSTLLAAVPNTFQWSPTVGLVMVLCNILAIAFGKWTMKYPSSDPQLPSPSLFGGFGLPAVLATASFGHILGAGAILGLHNLGVL
jgi:photosystem I subunit 10